MGREAFGTYTTNWVPPDYSVDDRGKLVGGYRPTGPSNWGRWGDDDVRGTANLISDEHVRRAASLVKRGRTFSLGLPLDDSVPRWPDRQPPKHYFQQTGSDVITGSPSCAGMPGFCWNDDAIDISLQGSTQWDGLAHAVADDALYNGFWAGTVTAATGSASMGIEAMRNSFTGRGVLLDFARHAGVDSLEPGFAIRAELIDEVAAAQGVEIGTGDIVLFRTGYGTRWEGCQTHDDKIRYFTDGEPGLSHHAIPWIAERDIAAVACDTVGFEVLPNEPDAPRTNPVHQALLVDLGLTIGELWDLEALAEDCAADRVYEFLLVAPPLHIPSAVGSPLNPIAIK